ncbi:N-6 DNA methylase [Oceanobacillus profundus]|uniref:site-specific DNA-methyltransferase (adenine-specific) n=1 Tax=Oceanobacillus profundus TaxID=372463 RepID=A0A417YMU7_9BACI|nr:N-6 DNA methylase [Oceanobacillus profundus]RHW35046.1 hypothetical protein D1B32_00015 [Oceanobacillus profundus]
MNLSEIELLERVEEDLKRKGLPIVKKDVKIGRLRPDMVAYKVNENEELSAEVVVEIKSDSSLVMMAQQQLMKYVKELNTSYALLVTNEKNYWFDGKTFLPIDEPEFDSQYLINDEDMEQVIRGVIDKFNGHMRYEQIATVLAYNLLIRSYLSDNNQMDLWWNIKNEDDLIGWINEANKFYSIDINPLKQGLNEELVQFSITNLSALPPKSAVIQNVFLKVWEISRTTGQYLSPDHLRKLFANIIKHLSFDKDKVVDLAAGLGSIALEVMKVNKVNYMVAFEIQKETSNLFKILSIISGYGQINTVLADSLQENELLQDNTYALSLVDPPLRYKYKLSEDQISRFQVASNRKNVDINDLFIERAIQVTEPGGYILAIVPENVLFSVPSQVTRDLIKDKTIIEAIISLPPHTLKPYAAVKLSLLVLRKKKATDETANELFIAMAESIDEFDEIVSGFSVWKKGGDARG